MPLRPELSPLPDRLKALPVDARGYPVPWFVAWHDGAPEFRTMDATKWQLAVRDRRCWVCGGKLGRHLVFVVGPMCGINRTSSEPPCHRDCAEWSATNCPFLTRPKMVRREDDELNSALLAKQSAGTALDRNPGVALLWFTTSYQLFKAGGKLPLINMGPAEHCEWYAEGKPATRAQVIASVVSGLPALRTIAERQDAQEPGAGAVRELDKLTAAFERFYPTDDPNVDFAWIPDGLVCR